MISAINTFYQYTEYFSDLMVCIGIIVFIVLVKMDDGLSKLNKEIIQNGKS